MTATPAAVRIRGLRKICRPARYREVAALNGLDLDIGAGEIVALLGPSGAGKTTAVHILTAFRRRDTGEVTVLGTDPAAAGRGWRARIGIVPQHASDLGELTAVEAGAAGYLLKDTPRDALIGAIFAAARGETVLAPSVARRLVHRLRSAPDEAPAARETLSARETQVLALAGRGLTNAQIGRELFVSEATVKTHLLRAYAKLGVSGRTAAVTRTMELGVLPSPGRP